MDNQPPASAPLWKVGVPAQTMIASPGKGYVAGWDIPVVMADNSTFSVQIAAADFTPQNVQALIEDHVNRLVAIRALEGPTY
jgi:hypothetical protein